MINQQQQYYWYEQMRRRNSLLAAKVGFGGDDEPLPKYMVAFNNFFGNEIKTEMVEQGKSATAPQFNDDDFREYEQDLGGNTFKFKGWDKDFSNITSVTNVNSVYEADSQHVVIDAEPLIEGTGTVTGAGVYEVGQQITLQAVPAQDFTFVQWDDGENMNPRVMTAIASMPKTMFSARFVPQTQVKTVAVTCDETKGTVTGGGTYVVGETATVEATPKSGYEFEKWSDDTTEARKSFDVTEDVSLTAYFKVAVVKPFTINGVSYETLNAAIDGCEAGSTIEMTCDYDCNSTQTINKSITLDGKGNTINVDIADSQVIYFISGDTTVKNMNFVGNTYQIMCAKDNATSVLLDNISSDISSFNTGIVTYCPFTIKDSDLKVTMTADRNSSGGVMKSNVGGVIIIDNTKVDGSDSITKTLSNLHNCSDSLIFLNNGILSVINNSELKSKYATITTPYDATSTNAHAYVDNSTIIGGNGWSDENSERVAFVIGSKVNKELIKVSGNSHITGDLVVYGGTSG